MDCPILFFKKRRPSKLSALSLSIALFAGGSGWISAANAGTQREQQQVPTIRVCIDSSGIVHRLNVGESCKGTSATWSARRPAPVLCWDSSSLNPNSVTRVVSIRSDKGCAPRQRALTGGTRLLCADSGSGVLRFPVTNKCRPGNLETRVFIARASSTNNTASKDEIRAPKVSSISSDSSFIRFTLSEMSPDTGVYAVQWTPLNASFSSFQMVRATSRSVSLDTDLFSCNTQYTFRVFVMKSGWTLAEGHSNQNVTPQSETFNVTTAHPCAATLTAVTSATTTTVVLNCATGGTCNVGDTGPGGGIVFYVEPSDGTFSCGRGLSSTCKYLEVAPTTGTGAWTEVSRGWSSVTSPSSALPRPAPLPLAIGSGFRNTMEIVSQVGSVAPSAGYESRAYRGPSNLSDWYLPSLNELNELCKYAGNTGQPAGPSTVCSGATSSVLSARGFTTGTYWSSTERNNLTSRAQTFSTGAQIEYSSKSTTNIVRPIRAFGGTKGCDEGGVCAVGDTGPGGGVVFYVASSDFASPGSPCGTSCRYMEFGREGNSMTFAAASNQSVAITGADGTALGAGYQNSLDIVAQVGNAVATVAAQYTLDWVQFEIGDWHLPSRVELNEVCKYARTQTTGNTSVACSSSGTLRSTFNPFVNTYWSSSEVSASNAWSQSFGTSSATSTGKSTAYFPLPVRAFR